MSLSMDDPPNSRVFVVAGRNTSSEYLRNVFEQYGTVSFVKYLRDKGVAYVKYNKASAAALAIENLHEATLNGGQGPRLKVMLAESPHARNIPRVQYSEFAAEKQPLPVSGMDPDNVPPKSRLFMVVPKHANGSEIEEKMRGFPGMQYCKTDLIASKGIVFVKYSSSSAAHTAMEAVQAAGGIAGYRVKVMLAEPKSQRFSGPSNGMYDPRGEQPSLISSKFMENDQRIFYSASPNYYDGNLQSDYGSGFAQGLTSLMGTFSDKQGGFGAREGLTISSANNVDISYGSKSLGDVSEAIHSNQGKNVDLNAVPPGNRLFVVVHKSVNEEALAMVFRCFPGMEYLDLKRDRLSGRSRGFAYVKYYSLDSAKTAQSSLNGMEFPQGSGCMLKVLFAAPLNVSRARQGEFSSVSVSSTNSDVQNSPAKAFFDTPSQDGVSAATNFQLPSPNTSDSVGQFAYGTQYLINSARTDLSSASHESIISPLSSPLRDRHVQQDCNGNSNGEQSLGEFKLDFGIFEGADESQEATNMMAGLSLGKSEMDAIRDSVESSYGSFSAETKSSKAENSVYSVLKEPLAVEEIEDMFKKSGHVENVELFGSKLAKIQFSDEHAAKHAMRMADDLAAVVSISHLLPEKTAYE
ncbi:RNA-binding protein 45 [Picochlorum sp. SENEW3]|nr:RNA-binding protein 45 [Picochlorum sp. SENEW3]